jgi:hypothetical protein
MNLNQIVEKFKTNPAYVGMGAGKLANRFNCSKDDIYKARSIVKGEIKEDNNNNAKILLFDLETSPILAQVWGTRKQYVYPEQIVRDWTILTYAAKWLNDDTIYSGSAFGEEDFDDFEIVSQLWSLLDEANIIIAHNLKRFDKQKLNARFLFHGLTVPSPYKMIDTLEVARQNFGTTYHKLDYLSKFIGSDGKMEHSGFELWKRCMNGEEESWKIMLDYNIKDVLELEKVYLAMRSWDSRHPSISIFQEDPDLCCTKCGSKNLVYKKDTYTNTRVFKLYQCNDCHGWSRSRSSEGKIKALMTQ